MLEMKIGSVELNQIELTWQKSCIWLFYSVLLSPCTTLNTAHSINMEREREECFGENKAKPL